MSDLASLVVGADATALADPAVVPPAWWAGVVGTPHPSGELAAALASPDARSVEGVVVRSMTRVGPAELAAMPRLRALATLSSGVDHLDLDALGARGVSVSTGLGGNAPAVAGWVDWALRRCASVSGPQRFTGMRVVVVGVGAVGSAVAAHLRAAGAEVLAVDPPRQARDPAFVGMSLAAALATRPEALTLHVPLVRQGPWPTLGLLDAEAIDALRGAIVLQASRGGVLNEPAALKARSTGWLQALALDVYCDEPRPNPALLAVADLATPHIAGHTVEGKLRVAGRALVPFFRALGHDSGPSEADVEAQCAAAAAALGWARPGELGDAALDAAAAALRRREAFRSLRSAHRRLDPTPAIG